jgi:hypothetical protein
MCGKIRRLTPGLAGGRSAFISYRVASEAPLARIIFDELNHTLTPGGHRVTVYYDELRLVKVPPPPTHTHPTPSIQVFNHCHCTGPLPLASQATGS